MDRTHTGNVHRDTLESSDPANSSVREVDGPEREIRPRKPHPSTGILRPERPTEFRHAKRKKIAPRNLTVSNPSARETRIRRTGSNLTLQATSHGRRMDLNSHRQTLDSSGKRTKTPKDAPEPPKNAIISVGTERNENLTDLVQPYTTGDQPRRVKGPLFRHSSRTKTPNSRTKTPPDSHENALKITRAQNRPSTYSRLRKHVHDSHLEHELSANRLHRSRHERERKSLGERELGLIMCLANTWPNAGRTGSSFLCAAGFPHLDSWEDPTRPPVL